MMFGDLRPYPEYAERRSPWIPAFPTTWRVVPGTGVLREVKAKNSGLREKTVLSLSYGRVIVKSEDTLHGLVPASFEGHQILEPGDIVIRPTDLQNDQTSLRVGAVQNHGIITSAYIGLRPQHIDNWFAFLYLKALDHMKVFYGMGSGLRQNLDFSDFKRLPVPIPTVEEQKAIVTYLAHAHQRIDQAIATKRSLIALSREQTRAIVRQAVERGIDHRVPTQDSGIPWIGEYPAHWELRRIANVFDNLDHRRVPLSSEVRGQMSLRKYDYYGASGVIDQVDDFIFDEATILVAEDGANLVLRNLPLAIKATGKYWVNNHAHIMRPRFGNVDYYVAALEAIDYRPWITGAAQPKLTQDRLKSVAIAVPPAQEQDSIVRWIGERTSGSLEFLAQAEREIKLLHEFKTRLTADVVTGQLDVRTVARALPTVALEEAFAVTVDGVGEDDEDVIVDNEQGANERVADE